MKTVADIANAALSAAATYLGTKEATAAVAEQQQATSKDNTKKALYISLAVVFLLLIVFITIKRK